MSIVIPNLDDRSYDDIRGELVGRIPVYTPQWTDHNEGDPGIALLELFSFLATSLQARLNLVPDATFRSYLRLLDLPLLPAQPSTAIVVVEGVDPAGPNLARATEVRAGPVGFETDHDVAVWPLDVLGVAKQADVIEDSPTVPPTRDQLARQAQREQVLKTQGIDPGADVRFYTQVALSADPLAPDAPTVDVGTTTVDDSLWIAVIGRPGFDRTKLTDRVLFIGIATDDTIDENFALETLEPDEVSSFRCDNLDPDRPGMLWRLWNTDRGHTPEEPAWSQIEVVGDSTRGLTRTGVVQLSMPEIPAYGHEQRGGPPTPNQSLPPPLDDPEQQANLIGWLQVKRPIGAESIPIRPIRWVGVNAVTVVQAQRTRQRELLGVGSGDAYQRFSLSHDKVFPDEVDLMVDEAAGSFTWIRVEDFTATGPVDRHYTVDRVESKIGFGSGKRPMFNERIHVHYRYGGGTEGRVDAGAITAIVDGGGLKATNPFPAWGGSEAESEAEALERIPAALRRRDRAVTENDFRELAAEEAGVGRAEALGAFHPDVRGHRAAGVVTVVVFPKQDNRDPRRPLPAQSLLRRVCSRLDERRLLTTELYVIPPTYVPVAVSVAVQAAQGAQVDRVRLDLKHQLESFLAPLGPGGPTAEGWPLGRTVRRAELEAVASRVEGVEYIRSLRLAWRSSPEGPWSADVDEVAIASWQLPGVAEMTVVQADTAPDPGTPPVDPPELTDPATPDTIFVPVAREVC